ncbi:hypothetical protein COLO4_33608 [Corchorus olitorius]|uniref:Uncharacterized protein n=1 Tax=Corchorus olitorius TaxID=93759 RepID=A0A1R3GSJ0_9ROSI|nr:hypothetical protein COLO4_33608 [Corchorus olitorius]
MGDLALLPLHDKWSRILKFCQVTAFQALSIFLIGHNTKRNNLHERVPIFMALLKVEHVKDNQPSSEGLVEDVALKWKANSA